MFLERHIYSYIQKMQSQFKVLLVTGSRQVGKSTLLKEKYTSYDYVVLDDYSELDMARQDPGLFFKNHSLPVIIDEVQRAA
ncbi:MAG: AAA family ATPase, partial [Spirochaetales bacterium]|nr:AAA family ATPase [Spirochaetales bacterium]